ncbi:resolvase, partial [Escherichia coli]|nr:resolvase [Escherichia coli]
WQLVGTVHPHNRWADKAKQDGIIRDNLEIYKLKKFRWECLLGEVLI